MVKSMTRTFALMMVATLLMIGCADRSATEQGGNASETRTLTICDVNGTELLTQHDILAYDTETHIFTLVPGKRDTIAPSQSLIGGSPFTIFVDGRSQYSGRFTTSLSSQSVDDVVIDLLGLGLENDQLQLSLGYPTRSVYTAKRDPRKNENVIAALRAMGKVGG